MRKVWIVLCSVLLMVSMASCSGGNAPSSAPPATQPVATAAPQADQPAAPAANIVGTWTWGSPSDPAFQKYAFSADGTLIKSFGPEGGKVTTFSGTYSNEGPERYKLTWTAEGKPVTVTCTVSGDTFLFDEDKAKGGDTSHWIWHRVK